MGYSLSRWAGKVTERRRTDVGAADEDDLGEGADQGERRGNSGNWQRGDTKGQDGSGRPQRVGPGDGGYQEEGWKREGPPPPLPQQQRQASRKRDSAPAVRPQKVISDPIVKIGFEVLSILNKITPQVRLGSTCPHTPTHARANPLTPNTLTHIPNAPTAAVI